MDRIADSDLREIQHSILEILEEYEHDLEEASHVIAKTLDRAWKRKEWKEDNGYAVVLAFTRTCDQLNNGTYHG